MYCTCHKCGTGNPLNENVFALLLKMFDQLSFALPWLSHQKTSSVCVQALSTISRLGIRWRGWGHLGLALVGEAICFTYFSLCPLFHSQPSEQTCHASPWMVVPGICQTFALNNYKRANIAIFQLLFIRRVGKACIIPYRINGTLRFEILLWYILIGPLTTLDCGEDCLPIFLQWFVG